MLQVTMQVDFGKDIGQSFGSLLEVRDSRGHVIAGAGFADVYNTMFRNDRYTVQFFVQPNSEDNQFTLEPLPRPIKEYGQVIRLKRPGNLAATMQPRGNPTELEFLLTRDSMTILQDGKQLASTKFGSKLTAEFKPASIAWGKGTFGPLQRTIRSNTVKPGIRG
ncbi:MAG: hypothetical protein HY318_07660 [Armatimonadetes bacterium]|nr:hypothetical protein [Armatimonadota bacterium]